MICSPKSFHDQNLLYISMFMSDIFIIYVYSVMVEWDISKTPDSTIKDSSVATWHEMIVFGNDVFVGDLE